MAELRNQQEPTFPSKRKPEDTEDPPKKSPKLATLDHNEAQEPNPISTHNDNSDKTESDVANNNHELQNDDVDDEDVDEDEDGDDDDDDEEEEEEEDEVDRKGKSVVRDDKGKGKMIEEEEEDDDDSDDDDDDDSGGNISGDESDFSDDPLAEVDLNNILPSRTRRRTAHPGVHIASDKVNAVEDDGDSDDSDA